MSANPFRGRRGGRGGRALRREEGEATPIPTRPRPKDAIPERPKKTKLTEEDSTDSETICYRTESVADVEGATGASTSVSLSILPSTSSEWKTAKNSLDEETCSEIEMMRSAHTEDEENFSEAMDSTFMPLLSSTPIPDGLNLEEVRKPEMCPEGKSASSEKFIWPEHIPQCVLEVDYMRYLREVHSTKEDLIRAISKK